MWKSRLILFILSLAFCFSSPVASSLPLQSIPSTAYASDVDAEIMGAGGAAVWMEKKVNVLLFTGDYWTPILENMVNDARGALPPRGPNLKVKKMGVRSCDWVDKQKFSQPTITFCEKEAWFAGETGLHNEHHIVQKERAKIAVIAHPEADISFDMNTACHEMMHALVWISDNYHYPHKDSCVQGDVLSTFGPWDVQFLATAYQKHDTKANQKRQDKREDRKHNGRRSGKHGGRK